MNIVRKLPVLTATLAAAATLGAGGMTLSAGAATANASVRPVVASAPASAAAASAALASPAQPAGPAAIAAATPVAAPAARIRCDRGDACVWRQTGFRGPLEVGTHQHICYTPFFPQPHFRPPGGHSVINHLGVKITVFSGVGCTGHHFAMRPGQIKARTPFAVRSVLTS